MLINVGFFALLLSGCASANYQKAAPDFLGHPNVVGDVPLIVSIAQVIPGKPFSETVCDNAAGVIWSAQESREIGFSQDYATLFVKKTPQPGMTAPPSPGLINVDSRIMVPFGRFITENLKQAIGESGQVCEDDQCLRQARQKWPDARMVLLNFTKFRVAEEQRNMLLLEVEGEMKATSATGAPVATAIHSRVNESITSAGLRNMVTVMNGIANLSTSQVVEQVMAAGR